MKYFIVEHIYYKQRFLVRAKSETEAKIKVLRELEKKNSMRARLTEFEVYKLPALSLGEDVAWL